MIIKLSLQNFMILNFSRYIVMIFFIFHGGKSMILHFSRKFFMIFKLALQNFMIFNFSRNIFMIFHFPRWKIHDFAFSTENFYDF